MINFCGSSSEGRKVSSVPSSLVRRHFTVVQRQPVPNPRKSRNLRAFLTVVRLGQRLNHWGVRPSNSISVSSTPKATGRIIAALFALDQRAGTGPAVRLAVSSSTHVDDQAARPTSHIWRRSSRLLNPSENQKTGQEIRQIQDCPDNSLVRQFEPRPDGAGALLLFGFISRWFNPSVCDAESTFCHRRPIGQRQLLFWYNNFDFTGFFTSRTTWTTSAGCRASPERWLVLVSTE